VGESPVHAAVRRARVERARARGEPIPTFDIRGELPTRERAYAPPPNVTDRYGSSRYGGGPVQYGGGAGGGVPPLTSPRSYEEYDAPRNVQLPPNDTRLVQSGVPAERTVSLTAGLQAAGSADKLSPMVQLQGMQISSLQRDTEAVRRAAHAEVEAVKGRVVELEERVHSVEGACRNAVDRCVSEMTQITAALTTRRTRGEEEEESALLQRGPTALATYETLRAQGGADGALKVGRPPPPPGAESLLRGGALGLAPSTLTEDEADASALLRGFARGRVLWYNNWRSDFWWYVKCNFPPVAMFASHPCSPLRRWQHALVWCAQFGFLSWMTYSAAAGTAYGQWLNERVCPWAKFKGRWPAGLSQADQRAGSKEFFDSDRLIVGMFLGLTFALIYQLLLLNTAVPPRFLPTRPELFLLAALGGVSALGVMISEAVADEADGGIVVLLLLYSQTLFQGTALIVDLCFFQAFSQTQMQMLLRRQLGNARVREAVAGGDPERALAAAAQNGELTHASSADHDEISLELVSEPLGPDRAHPSARCCSAKSLYSRAYPYDLRYPRTDYLDQSWVFDPLELAEMLQARAAEQGRHYSPHPTAKPRGAGSGLFGGKQAARGANGKKLSLMDMAADYILEHSQLGKETRGAARMAK
jgi:hypothetical protein